MGLLSRIAAGAKLAAIIGFFVMWLKALADYDHPVDEDEDDWP